MDPIQIEKFRAKKRHMRNAFLMYRFIRFSLSILFLGLFLSCPLWLPGVFYSIRFFLRVLLPGIRTFFLGPKCLFFICNVIIVFLLGESKRSGSSISSNTRDVYDEYMEKSRSMRAKLSTMECKETDTMEQVKPVPVSTHVDSLTTCRTFSIPSGHVETDVEEEEEEEEVVVVEEEEEEEEEEGVEEEDNEDVDGDELNKRVEDFIARINAQRRLEARMLQVCTSSWEETIKRRRETRDA